jgi:deazaflavin-dependent oxidoreductase (nitroreductase family)
MAYPRWLARLNRRLINPREVRRGRYPVVSHIGRSSGKTYQTPLDAFPTRDGYVMVARYGPDSDWVQNILAKGTAELRVDDDDHLLGSPRLVSQTEALQALAVDTPKDFTKARDFVLMTELPRD